MTVGLAVIVAFVAGVIAVALGRTSRVGTAITLVGLVALVVLAASIQPEPRSLVIGDGTIVGHAYVRLYLVLGGTAALLLAVLGVATGAPTTAGGVALLALAGGGLALATSQVVVAILASVAGSVAAAVVVADRRSGPRITVAARALRAIVAAAILALAGVVWLAAGQVGGPFPGLVPAGEIGLPIEPGVIGVAYLAAAAAVAIRSGAIPFHGWTARIAEATPPVGLPAGLVLGPAAFAVVMVSWLDGSVNTIGEPLPVERAIVIVVAAASLLLGAVAAWLHDDLEHVIAYSLVQDAGVILLAIAALDPAAWEPVRLWVLAVVVVKSGLAGWAAAVRHTFGTGRVPELGGWARRSPVLALAFAILLVAAMGLPGLAAFEARAALIGLVLDGPLALFLLLGGLAPVAYLGRILLVGLDKPSAAVRSAPSPMPTWTGPRTLARGPGETITSAAAAMARAIPATARANRGPIAAVLVLVLASLAIAVSAGGLGTVQAAAEPPIDGGLAGSFQPEGPGAPSSEPGPSNGADLSGSPSATSPAAGAPTELPSEPVAGGSAGGTSDASSVEPAASASEAPSANPGPSFEPVATP